MSPQEAKQMIQEALDANPVSEENLFEWTYVMGMLALPDDKIGPAAAHFDAVCRASSHGPLGHVLVTICNSPELFPPRDDDDDEDDG